jgi:rubrerythrin
MFIAAAMPKDVRSELSRLLERYRSVEVYVCRGCGYAELRFVKR